MGKWFKNNTPSIRKISAEEITNHSQSAIESLFIPDCASTMFQIAGIATRSSQELLEAARNYQNTPPHFFVNDS